MCFAFRRAALGALAVVALTSVASARELRVCADPNNLPFSNDRGEGFENRIARIVADEIGAEVSFVWWAQRRGYVRNTLKAGLCDLVPGAAVGVPGMATTRPYYSSTYVFVTRAGEPVVSSFDDPGLRTRLVGVQLVGDDGWNTPPAHALAARGVVANVRGYNLYGDYRQPNPPARIVDAVASRDIDVAVAWGPMAGYFATREPAKLVVTPVDPAATPPLPPMRFDIAMGVRPADKSLRDDIQGALDRRRADIDAVLASYGVPRVDAGAVAGARP
ncbi:substrate-binding domain-containing protein [Alsobacter sp. SYSU M60028]|uniref:Substrate-binding domain-containing protein n=1 Tax=Alsobacter ponti TaxID=2962936 RepID=A0ABT1LHE7_9HYPH|nr:substrate-binding domain-containing protein [Alsobacter ponti]MCP8940879.1 substrate-binding domain-containing protein [Alsobacter ponti]